MLKQNQHLRLQQRISPQQIQFIKLLQIPTASLEQRIKEEIEQNPVLEDFQTGYQEDSPNEVKEPERNDTDSPSDDREEWERNNDIAGIDSDDYDTRTRLPKGDDDDDDYQAPIANQESLLDQLETQLSLLNLTEKERLIGEQLIGSIDEDGYLSHRSNVDPIKAIVNFLGFRNNVRVTPEEVEGVLAHIQRFDPPGIGARDLQECLMLQLKRKERTPLVELAMRIIEGFFEELQRKHFDKMRSRLGVSDEMLRDAYELIKKLNPKPGEPTGSTKHEVIIPDFIVKSESGRVQVMLNTMNSPDLRISKHYVRMYKEYAQLAKSKKSSEIKETLDFVKNKIEAAQWFIDALRQRQFTLLDTMQAIVDKQEEFFISGGDERKLRPMILKDIADVIEMDISTVSRVANSKFVQTDFGILPLKFFFSEGIETEDGMVSNREVKKILEDLISAEEKTHPLSDDALADLLKEKGYNIARRTVAKYREQLGLPVARLRKEV